MNYLKPLAPGEQFYTNRLGLVTIDRIESAGTAIVRDSHDRYFRVSGLSINYRSADKIEEVTDMKTQRATV